MGKFYRKEYSDASYEPGTRREMVYAKRKWAMPPAQNRLLYSSYNTAFWTCNATDSGLISVGPYADTNRVSYDMNNVASENGVQTWQGNGTYRSDSGINVSAADEIVFSCIIGGYQQSSTQIFTCTLGVCNEAGDSLQTVRVWNIVGSGRAWFHIDTADITEDTTDLCFYVSVVPSESDGEWFIINAQVEFNELVPKNFIATSGAALVRSVDTNYRSVNKIHRREHERVPEDYEGIVTPREGNDQSSNVIPFGET
jgi:hypothetical protein